MEVYQATGWWDVLWEGVEDPEQREKLRQFQSEINSNSFENSYKALRGIEVYNPYDSRYSRLTPLQNAVLANLRHNSDSFAYLLHAIKTAPHGNMDFGSIYSIGEYGNPQAIPLLKETKAQNRNWYMQFEVNMALAKCGDTSAVLDVYKLRTGDLPHRRQMDALMRHLTRQNFGEISDETSADDVFARWNVWIEKNESKLFASNSKMEHSPSDR